MGSLAGARTRPSQRPYFWPLPLPQAMPAVVPSASPLMVRTPSATLAAAGERVPLSAWPARCRSPSRRGPSVKSSSRLGVPQPCVAPARWCRRRSGGPGRGVGGGLADRPGGVGLGSSGLPAAPPSGVVVARGAGGARWAVRRWSARWSSRRGSRHPRAPRPARPGRAPSRRPSRGTCGSARRAGQRSWHCSCRIIPPRRGGRGRLRSPWRRAIGRPRPGPGRRGRAVSTATGPPGRPVSVRNVARKPRRSP